MAPTGCINRKYTVRVVRVYDTRSPEYARFEMNKKKKKCRTYTLKIGRVIFEIKIPRRVQLIIYQPFSFTMEPVLFRLFAECLPHSPVPLPPTKTYTQCVDAKLCFFFFFFFVDPHPFGGIYANGVNDRDGGKTGIR